MQIAITATIELKDGKTLPMSEIAQYQAGLIDHIESCVHNYFTALGKSEGLMIQVSGLIIAR